jgi:hypothetical protein
MYRIFVAAMVIRLDHFLSLVDAYRKATGLAEATISTRVMKDGKRLRELRAGRDIGVRRLEEAITWFSDHWPKDAPWPADIPRPEKANLTPEQVG